MLRQLENLKNFLRFRGFTEAGISRVLVGNFKNVAPMYKCIALRCDGEEFQPHKFDYEKSHLEGLILFDDSLISIRVTNGWELNTSILTPIGNATDSLIEYLEELKDFGDLKTYLIDIYQENLFPFVSDQFIDDETLRKWFKENKDVEEVQLLNGKNLVVIKNINNEISITATQR